MITKNNKKKIKCSYCGKKISNKYYIDGISGKEIYCACCYGKYVRGFYSTSELITNIDDRLLRLEGKLKDISTED